ncbi:hypothetical protein [Peptoniphilus timonensis]|uniref:hypothetical protein n=1 Tax=Peptoniphilus timonensis TaxID=1268254 RepID=UPI0002DBFC91|nr:hypothetical protein [Peptoniphilus timonensis]
MTKIDSLEKLLSIKESRHHKTILRDIGNMADEDVIEIFIRGNEKAKYAEIENLFDELKSFVRNKGMRNCKFLFQDDPNQDENFNIEISFNVRSKIKADSIDIEKIEDFIDHIASIKNEAQDYEKEVENE